MSVSSGAPPVWPHWTTSPKSLRHWTTTMARGKGQRANTVHEGALFSVNPNGGGLAYTPGATFSSRDLIAIDTAIRWLPEVREALRKKGLELIASLPNPEDFELVEAGGKSRPRYYVVPKDSKGIRAELSASVLTVAAMAMRGR
jgi:hypothetical protein